MGSVLVVKLRPITLSKMDSRLEILLKHWENFKGIISSYFWKDVLFWFVDAMIPNETKKASKKDLTIAFSLPMSKLTKTMATVNNFVMVFLLLTLNIFHTFWDCFYCWRWRSTCQLCNFPDLFLFFRKAFYEAKANCLQLNFKHFR